MFHYCTYCLCSILDVEAKREVISLGPIFSVDYNAPAYRVGFYQ